MSYNDVVLQYSWISRTHAYIENRNGVFMVKDKSTNGTIIYPQDADPVHIIKREYQLAGKGFSRTWNTDKKQSLGIMG